MTRYERRARRQYQRAVRRAFAQVTFYREQCAAAGRLLTEPVPTPADALPQPPHTLCPFAQPWSPEREPSLWTPTLRPLARALWLAGCRERLPVLEVRQALLDRDRLPRRHRLRPTAYRVLLSPTAVVSADAHRAALNQHALAVGAAWVVGSPDELAAAVPAGDRFRPVHRLPVAAVTGTAATDVPVVLYEPMLGYLGARVPQCRQFHLDAPRVYARERDGTVSFSLPRSRRPTMLDIVPAGADRVTVQPCPRHGTPTLAVRRPG